MKCARYLLGAGVVLNYYIRAVTSLCSWDAQAEDAPKGPSYPSLSYIFNSSSSECECEKDHTCTRKCCSANYHLDDAQQCTFKNNSPEFKVPVYQYGNVIIDGDLNNAGVIFGMIKCASKGEGFYETEPKEFFLQEDGRLWVSSINMYFDHDDYCLEHDENWDLVAYLCVMDYDIQGLKLSERLTIIGMIISLPFLLVTFIIYAVLPLRNVHGKSLMCYVFALFATYLLHICVHLYPDSENFTAGACRTIELLEILNCNGTINLASVLPNVVVLPCFLATQVQSVGWLAVPNTMLYLFFFLASFFWMNVMCIDISWTFSGSRGFIGNTKRAEKRQFLLYSGYAWGSPLLLVILVLILSSTVKRSTWYNPGITSQQCWLNEGIPTLLYLYLPMALLITINITLFAVTAYKIRETHQHTAVLREGDNKNSREESDRQRFGVYLKLFLAMGVNWSMEIISWAVNWQVEHVPQAVWYLTEFCNAAFGVFIFFIFVFKKNIWILLKKRYYARTGSTYAEKPSLRRTTVSTISKT